MPDYLEDFRRLADLNERPRLSEGWWIHDTDPKPEYLPFKPLLEQETQRLTGLLGKLGQMGPVAPPKYKWSDVEDFWTTEWVIEADAQTALPQAQAIIKKAGYNISNAKASGFRFKHKGFSGGTASKQGKNRFSGWVEVSYGTRLLFYFTWTNSGTLSFKEREAVWAEREKAGK